MTETAEEVSIEDLLGETPACQVKGERCAHEATWRGHAHCKHILACQPCMADAKAAAVWHLMTDGYFRCHLCGAAFVRVEWEPL